MKFVLLLLGLLALGGAGWHVLQANGGIAGVRAALPLPGAAAVAGGQTRGGARGGLRKCVVDGRALYTDEACPMGSREDVVAGGAVSVLPAAPAASRPGTGRTGTGLPTVRDLLVKPDEPSIGDKRIDEATR